MTSESLVDRLASLAVFAAVPRSELQWLVELGEERTILAGSRIVETVAPTAEMVVVLTGHVSLYVQRGGGSRKFGDAGTGQIVGMMPYSRFQRMPGVATVDEVMSVFVLHQRHFPALIRECPELTTALVHHMLDRAANFRATLLNDERLQSLSRLASGFAHELNNPASAASRTAQSLVTIIDDEGHAARDLAAARLTDGQLEAVDAVRTACGSAAAPRSALEAADREDDIAEWLTRHGMTATVAEALAASEVTISGLDRLAGALPPEALAAAIRWISSGCAARTASRQIEGATRRIHDLVNAVKGFTFMDREAVPDRIDIARGLADTVAMLEGKIRSKSATVQVETAPDLPHVFGVGSEINQVWQKLVDNALDAVGSQGRVTITATARGDSIVVRVADDGPGVPEEIRARIFDPFFTTKGVGSGAGLGLDIARRIVHLYRGDLEFSSQPGHTVFRVRLPVAGTTV